MGSHQKAETTVMCSKSLWLLISGATELKSLEAVRSELDSNAVKILSGPAYYTTSGTKDESVEWKNAASALPSDIIAKLKQAFVISDGICGHLFYSYLLHEYHDTASNVTRLFSTDKSTQDFMREISDFYLSERLFLLATLKEIVGHSDESSLHPYKQLYFDFAVKHQVQPRKGNSTSEPNWFSSLVTQLAELRDSPPYYRQSDDVADKRNLLFRLREISEILQILVLYTHRFHLPPGSVSKLFHTLSSPSFYDVHLSKTSRESFKYSERNDSICEFASIVRIIRLLESCLLLAGLRVVELLTEADKRSSPLFSSRPDLKTIHKIVMHNHEKIGRNLPSLNLAWMLVCTLEMGELEDSNDTHSPSPSTTRNRSIELLGQSVIKHNAFEWLSQSLDNPDLALYKGTPMRQTIDQILYDLIHTTFSIFEVENMSTIRNSVYDLTSTLLKGNHSSVRVLSDRSFSNVGIGSVIGAAMTRFPYEAVPMLNIINSISRCDAKTCSKLMDVLSSDFQGTLCEKFDPSSSLVKPFDTTGIYQLIQLKCLFNSPLLSIPAGTLGQVHQIEGGGLIIQWTGVEFNLCSALTAIFRYHLDNISEGGAHSQPTQHKHETEMALIATFCGTMMQNCPNKAARHLQEIADLSVNAFEALSQFPRPPRRLMASLLSVGTGIIRHELANTSEVWSRFVSTRFFPYMIGLKSSDIPAMANGMDTDSSLLSDLIISQESVQGNYELTLAFLDFITAHLALIASKPASQAEKLIEDSDLLASVIFISNYIFPLYRNWNYVSDVQSVDKTNGPSEIGRRCLDIFSLIMKLKSDGTSEGSSLIKRVLTQALMGGHAGECLLFSIQEAESNVKRCVLLATSSEILRSGCNSIAISRSSLAVLNHLLSAKSSKRSDEETTEQTSSSSTSNVSTPLERVLFTPHSHDNPHMLLIACRLGQQKYDCRLSTLAVDLLRHLAIQFPMSMLACLGRHADSVRDHFLLKLDAITEDLWLKVSLLKFMSACIVHQPGLMELFLRSESEGEFGCFQTVVEILKEKKIGHFYCPDELHNAALNFIYAFWFQSHMSAIDSLRNWPDIWNLITFPLIDLPRSLDIPTTHVILKLLAREIYLVKSRSKNLHRDLQQVLVELTTGSQLMSISKMMVKYAAASQIPLTKRRIAISAYRDFIISLAVMNPISLSSQLKASLVSDLLEMVSENVSATDGNYSLLATQCDCLLIVLSRWKETGHNEPPGSVPHRLAQILGEVTAKFFAIPFSCMTSFNYLTCQVLAFSGDSLSNEETIIDSSCRLLAGSCRVIEKSLSRNPRDSSSELEWATSCTTLLDSVVGLKIRDATDNEDWLQTLRSHSMIELILTTSTHLIDNKLALPFVEASISSLLTLSSNISSAKLLLATGLVDDLTLVAQSLHSSSSFASSTDGNLSRKTAHLQPSWLKIFHSIIRLMSTLMRSLQNEFMENALNFVAVHLTQLDTILMSVSRVPHVIDVEGASETVELLSSIALCWHHSHQIPSQLPPPFARILDRSYRTCNTTIAFITRTQLLNLLLTNPESRDVLSKNLLVPNFSSTQRPKFPSLQSTIARTKATEIVEPGKHETQKSFLPEPPEVPLLKPVNLPNLMPVSGDKLPTEPQAQPLAQNDLLPQVEKALVGLTSRFLSLFTLVTPSVLQLFTKQGLVSGEDWHLVLDPHFGSPSIDEDSSLTFGSLLTCIGFLLSSRSRSTKDSPMKLMGSSSQSDHMIGPTGLLEEEKLELMLEKALSLVVSQALVAHLSGSVNERDREHICRELKSELVSVTSAVARQSKRSVASLNDSSSLRSTSPGSKSQLLARPFIRLLLDISDKLF